MGRATLCFVFCSFLLLIATAIAAPAGVVGKFAAIGAYGTAAIPGNKEGTVYNRILSVFQPDFIITLGGNNLPNGAPSTIDENIGQFYHQYIQGYHGRYGGGAASNSFYPALGNEDYVHNLAEPFIKYFPYMNFSQQLFYDFTVGPAHFFCLNSVAAIGDGSPTQQRWVKQKLAETTSPHRIVYFYDTPYTSNPLSSSRGFQLMRWHFHDWGATLVLSGSERFYERLELWDLPYVNLGISGHPDLQPVGEKAYPGSQVRYNRSWGALLVDVTVDELFVQVQAIDFSVVDTFSVKRKNWKPPILPQGISTPVAIASVAGMVMSVLFGALIIIYGKKLYSEGFFDPANCASADTETNDGEARGHSMSRFYDESDETGNKPIAVEKKPLGELEDM